MTNEKDYVGYASARAVDSAIKEAARKAALKNPSRTVGEYIALAYFDRLLCRVFSVGDQSQWLLKGGNGMLARLADARHTTDLDMHNGTLSRQQAKTELIALAKIDLKDFFSFQFRSEEPIIGGDAQPNVEGFRLKFDVYLGATHKKTVSIDIAVGKVAPNRVETISPASRLGLPKLVTFDYRLWPIENQIADKACASIKQYKSGESSRSKDLFDLLAIAQTQKVNSMHLAEALSYEAAGRNIQLGTKFDFPESWWGQISERFKNSDYLKPFANVGEVSTLLDRFLFGHDAEHEQVWNPETLNWQASTR